KPFTILEDAKKRVACFIEHALRDERNAAIETCTKLRCRFICSLCSECVRCEVLIGCIPRSTREQDLSDDAASCKSSSGERPRLRVCRQVDRDVCLPERTIQIASEIIELGPLNGHQRANLRQGIRDLIKDHARIDEIPKLDLSTRHHQANAR